MDNKMIIQNKTDMDGVDKIISIGYPDNIAYLDELLEWTADPNWPVAGKIYDYIASLGTNEVQRVLNLAAKETTDLWWKYTLIVQIISQYDDATIDKCLDFLKSCARNPGTEECDIEALRILATRKLLDHEEIATIAKRNLYVYNLYIKETLEIAEASINKFNF